MATARATGHGVLQPVDEHAPIGQGRERIEVRHVANFFFHLLALGDVGDVAHHLDHLAIAHFGLALGSNPQGALAGGGEAALQVEGHALLDAARKGFEHPFAVERRVAGNAQVNRRLAMGQLGLHRQLVDAEGLGRPVHAGFFNVPLPAANFSQLLGVAQQAFAVAQGALAVVDAVEHGVEMFGQLRGFVDA